MNIYLPSNWIARSDGSALVPVSFIQNPIIEGAVKVGDTLTLPVENRSGVYYATLERIGGNIKTSSFVRGIATRGATTTYKELSELDNKILVWGAYFFQATPSSARELRWGAYGASAINYTDRLFSVPSAQVTTASSLRLEAFDPELSNAVFSVAGYLNIGTVSSTIDRLLVTISSMQDDFYISASPCSCKVNVMTNRELTLPRDILLGASPRIGQLFNLASRSASASYSGEFMV